MRQQGLEQRFRKLRVVVVETLGYACRQQGHRFDQVLDMGIVTRFAGHLQPAGNARIALGKFAAIAPQQQQFAFEIRQQGVHACHAP